MELPCTNIKIINQSHNKYFLITLGNWDKITESRKVLCGIRKMPKITEKSRKNHGKITENLTYTIEIMQIECYLH